MTDWSTLYTTPAGVKYRLYQKTGSVFVCSEGIEPRFYCKGNDWPEFAKALGLKIKKKGKK